ncbi:MAG: hypothetical protein QOK04_1051 [Solirubrobacteraceae bacterium]|jgi:hypothetical protein|nr:hypothetical protein [Solirubrobacteraceae bacterium]
MTSPFHYVEPPDVPEGMTLAEYRRMRCAPPRPRFLARLKRRMSRAARSRVR